MPVSEGETDWAFWCCVRTQNAFFAAFAHTFVDLCQQNKFFLHFFLQMLCQNMKCPYLCSVKRKQRHRN